MKWRLIGRQTLWVALGFDVALFWLFLFEEPPAVMVWLAGLTLAIAFTLPSIAIGRSLPHGSPRFAHGLFLGWVGWSLGAVASPLVLPPLVLLLRAARGGGDFAQEVGEAAAYVALLLWLLSPGMGVITSITGGIIDRRDADAEFKAQTGGGLRGAVEYRGPNETGGGPRSSARS